MSSTRSRSSATIPWSVHPKQREFCESDTRYRTLVAGRRFGKNHAGIVSEADFALDPSKYEFGRDNPEKVVLWWIGTTYNQTKKYGFNKARAALPDELIESVKKSAPFEIHLTNGVSWEFYSYDRPNSLDGAGVDSMVIDERGYMDTEIWETNLAAMLLDTNGRVAFIGKPWYNDHFEETYSKGQSDDHPNYASWQATSYDNPLIPDERIDEIFGHLPEKVYNREILAQFDAGGTLLTLDMLESEPAETLEGKKWDWHVAVDLGVEMNRTKAEQNDTDYWSCSIVAEHPTMPHAYLVEVNRTRGQTPAQAASWVRQCIAGYPTNRVRYESVQAQSWFEEDLKQAGLDPIPVTPQGAKEDRIVMLSVPFSNGNVKLIDWGDVPGKDMDWQPFKSEWASFPDGDHDDQLDSTAMALDTVNFQGELPALSGDMYGMDT